MTHPSPDAEHALRLLTAEVTSTTTAREHFSSPTVIQAAGSAIAAALADDRPEVIVTWESLEDVVLAYEVARQLGIRTAVVQEPQEGVLALNPALWPGARVALLATVFDRMTRRDPAASLIRQQGALLVRTASLAPVHDGADTDPDGPAHVVLGHVADGA